MKTFCSLILLLTLIASPLYAQETGFAGRPITSNLSMPTGNTLHGGEFSVGIGPVEYGLTDNLQIGTNLLLFIFQIYNAEAKFSIIDTEQEALAFGIGVAHFNLGIFGADVSFTSISPFVSYSMPIAAATRLHLSANYTEFSSTASVGDAEDLSAGISGTSIAAGVEHSLSNKTKILGELGYDVEFEGLRLGGGVLFGWDTFRLKLGLQHFSPKGFKGYVFPYVGLWWRFRG